MRPGARKVFKRGGKPYQRLAEHIGAFPLVLLSPADIFLVTGDGADRRRFIDQIICQSDSRYLDAQMRYQNVLEQRNRLLKDENSDDSLFEVLEFQLEAAGNYISARPPYWTSLKESSRPIMPQWPATASRPGWNMSIRTIPKVWRRIFPLSGRATAC